MPRKKKHPSEWTTEEAMKKLFPKPVRDHAKRLADSDEKPQVKDPKGGINKESS